MRFTMECINLQINQIMRMEYVQYINLSPSSSQMRQGCVCLFILYIESALCCYCQQVSFHGFVRCYIFSSFLFSHGRYLFLISHHPLITFFFDFTLGYLVNFSLLSNYLLTNMRGTINWYIYFASIYVRVSPIRISHNFLLTFYENSHFSNWIFKNNLVPSRQPI